MSGRTSIQADLGLNLYRTSVPTWISFFTTNPGVDSPTGHGGVEWGPARIRVFKDAASGSPYWSAPEDLTPFVRVIRNVGSLIWNTITLTTSPSTIVGVGVFDLVSGGNLRTWYPLETVVAVADGQSHALGTSQLEIRSD